MKRVIVLSLLLILFLISFNSVLAQQEQVDLYFFYGSGCPHCAMESAFLDELEEKYPELRIQRYEIYFDQKNRELYFAMADALNVDVNRMPVPVVFIDQKAIAGFSSNVALGIEKEVERCIAEGCSLPKIAEEVDILQPLTIGAVLSAAAVDAINPCAFAVLIILLTTILITKKKLKALWAGLAFTAAIYISYLAMGFGLYSVIQVTGLIHIFYIVVAILAVFVGLFNLKDYLWYGKWFIMEVPMSWRPKLKSLLKGITSISGAFAIGFVVSLFLLPCTSGPYIVILGLLAKTATRDLAILLLLLYNFIFILPMLAITLGIYFGFTTVEQAEEWRLRKLKVLHLIAGVIILLLGIGMLIALGLGII